MGMTLRTAIRPFALAALLAAPAAPAAAAGAFATANPRGIVIHDAVEVLQRFCQWEDGRLFLQLPGGARHELVHDINDPVIANPGDGAFHPYEPAVVRQALAEVRFPLAGIGAEVFLLPYPRRAALESAAGPGLILLAPGVRPLSATHQHAEFVHELGHVVQYALMPDRDAERWDAYAALRGLDLAGQHTAESIHCDRPHEVFAEDFRALFGGALANDTRTIENPELSYPTEVPGLAGFFLGLVPVAAPTATARLSGPQVARGAIVFSRGGTDAAALEVFDITGRVLVTLAPTVQAGSVSWTWDGRDADGTRRTGVFFARARDTRGGATRVTVLR
jgi:hypothetical protein